MAGAFAQACGFDTPAVSDVILAVGEACSNAVEHGHVERGEFTLVCTCEDGELRSEIADGGQGFEERPAGPFVGPLQWIGRGRGIAIMRALMDSVVCRRTRTGMSVILTKQLPRSASSVGETNGKLRGVDAGGCSQPR